MSTPYQPSEASSLLGISRSTLRRYADTFQEFLPDYGRRRKGDRRLFSDGDLRTLWAIMDLQKRTDVEGRDDLLDQLESPQGPQLVVPATLPRPDPETSPAARTAIQVAKQDDDQDSVPQVPVVSFPDLGPLVQAMERVVQQSQDQTLGRLDILDSRQNDFQDQLDRVRHVPQTVALLWFLAGVVVTAVAFGLALWLVR